MRHSGRSRGGDEPVKTDRGIEPTEHLYALDELAAREPTVDFAHKRGAVEAQRDGVEPIGSDVREQDVAALVPTPEYPNLAQAKGAIAVVEDFHFDVRGVRVGRGCHDSAFTWGAGRCRSRG